MSDALIVETQGAIATLTLNRAEKRDPISDDRWAPLAGLLADVAADDALEVLVVRGAGDEAFSAGADLGAFDRYRADAKARFGIPSARSRSARGARGRSARVRRAARSAFARLDPREPAVPAAVRVRGAAWTRP